MIGTLQVAARLRDDDFLRSVLVNALKLVLPACFESIIAVVNDALFHVPSKSVISQARFVLDQAYMLCMRRKHKNLFTLPQGGEEVLFPALYPSCDSSPQFGHNWLNSEYDFVCADDVTPVGKSYRQLVRLGRLEAPTQDELEEERKEFLFLKSAIKHHHAIPVALGSGMAGLVHELHCLFHQWFMETGSSKVMQRMCLATVAFLTDKGTERGLCTAPPVRFADILPHFVPYVFDDPGDGLHQGIDPDDYLHMPNTLQVSGGHHLVNNCAKNLCSTWLIMSATFTLC